MVRLFLCEALVVAYADRLRAEDASPNTRSMGRELLDSIDALRAARPRDLLSTIQALQGPELTVLLEAHAGRQLITDTSHVVLHESVRANSELGPDLQRVLFRGKQGPFGFDPSEVEEVLKAMRASP